MGSLAGSSDDPQFAGVTDTKLSEAQLSIRSGQEDSWAVNRARGRGGLEGAGRGGAVQFCLAVASG